MNQKKVARLKRQVRVRKQVRGTADRPRLNVFRSAKHMYAQLIDDTTGTTLAAASTRSLEAAETASSGNIAAAKQVGSAIAQKALAASITKVVFDRNGFLYHGRVKALAEAARENGLIF